jgi:hypothetical protein
MRIIFHIKKLHLEFIMKKAIVVNPHQSEFLIPLILKKGDFILGHDKENPWKDWLWCRSDTEIYGWVPKSYLKESQDKTGYFKVLQDYNATELTVQTGEQLTISFEENGWAWVRNESGDEGWVPLENLSVK